MTDYFREAREAYDQGMSLRRLRHRFHMSESELRDVCPEEFMDEQAEAKGNGGY